MNLAVQVAATHDRLASELLAVLTAAGYTTVHPSGRYIATRAVDSPATAAALRQLGQTAERLASDVVPQLTSNILLIHECMKALPQILTGPLSVAFYLTG